MLNLLKDSTFVLLLSIFLGLVLPGPAMTMGWLVTPALILMMAFSLGKVDPFERKMWTGNIASSFIGFLLNYGILSGLIVALSMTIANDDFRYGFLVMAAVPPAVAIMPMTRLLNGDVQLSLFSEVFSYIFSLALMPLIILIMTSKTGIGPSYLVEISMMLILLPALLSRVVMRLSIDPVLPINLGFFLITYIVIGQNEITFSGEIGIVVLIAVIRTFVIGGVIYFLAEFAGLAKSRAISYMLFGSFKNLGLAASVSLILFGPASCIPITISILAETGFFIILTFAVRAKLK